MARAVTTINGGAKASPLKTPRDPQDTEEFQMLPASMLAESPLNPRKHFNQHKLDELADSIRAKGIITPLIVRRGQSLDFEIAAGHRRFRAAKLAKVEFLPVRVLDLNDQEFLEVLTIENDQREDVHPLEQADGYKSLLESGKYSVAINSGHNATHDIASMADRIGRTEAYVRSRLELCDLIPVVRGSFLRDAITIGHARLISRVPSVKQESALAACFESYGDHRIRTVTDFRRDLQRMLKGEDLSSAPFDLNDDTLKRDAGACVACPKCSTPQRSLVDDMEGSLCLDGACYSQKLNAHIQRGLANGMVAISMKYSGDVKEGALSARGYVEAERDQERIEDIKNEIELAREEINDPEMLDPQRIKQLDDELKKSYAELAEAEADSGECAFMETGLVVDESYGDRVGKTMRICRNAACPVHGERVKENDQIYGNKRDVDPKEAERKAKEELERRVDRLARERAWSGLLVAMGDKPKVTEMVLYLAATGFLHMRQPTLKALGIEVQKGEYGGNAARKWLDGASQSEMVRFIVAGALEDPGCNEHFDREHNQAEWLSFVDMLSEYDLVYKEFEKEVRAELKTKSAKSAGAKKTAANRTAKTKDRKRAAAKGLDGDEEGG